MKTKMYLFLGLALIFALIWNASAQTPCTVESDCDSLDGIKDSPNYCVFDTSYYNVTNYFCNASSGYCEQNVSLPKKYRNCTSYTAPVGTPKYCLGNAVVSDIHTNYTCNASGLCESDGSIAQDVYISCSGNTKYGCLNGDQYLLDNVCDAAKCKVNSTALVNISYPGCSYASMCKDNAHSLISPLTSVKYTIGFDKNYTRSDNGSVYYVAPGATMLIKDISKLVYQCGNGAGQWDTSNIAVWVNNASDDSKLATAQNRIDIDDALNRTDVIGDNATTYGTPILNPFETVFDTLFEDFTKYNHIDSIYNFTAYHNHTVLVDLISGYCAPNYNWNTLKSYIISPNFVCPWLGGTNRSTLCNDHDGGLAEGWMLRENITVRVVSPNISIDAPPGEPEITATKVSKEWLITNTGVGDVVMSIKLDCGGWACAFDSNYTEGTEIRFEEGGLYNVPINITTSLNQPVHSVGIIVTYDDGYSLASIENQTKTSYITFGSPIIT